MITRWLPPRNAYKWTCWSCRGWTISPERGAWPWLNPNRPVSQSNFMTLTWSTDQLSTSWHVSPHVYRPPRSFPALLFLLCYWSQPVFVFSLTPAVRSVRGCFWWPVPRLGLTEKNITLGAKFWISVCTFTSDLCFKYISQTVSWRRRHWNVTSSPTSCATHVVVAVFGSSVVQLCENSLTYCCSPLLRDGDHRSLSFHLEDENHLHITASLTRRHHFFYYLIM